MDWSLATSDVKQTTFTVERIVDLWFEGGMIISQISIRSVETESKEEKKDVTMESRQQMKDVWRTAQSNQNGLVRKTSSSEAIASQCGEMESEKKKIRKSAMIITRLMEMDVLIVGSINILNVLEAQT
jgi:hypothetical protein